MADVFVSHAEEDEDVALEVARGLRSAGYTTWTYEENSDPGTSYLLNVEGEIERCRAVVLVISPDSLSSDQVTKEVVRAHEGAKPFVPLRRGISHVEFQQRRKEWRLALGAAVSIDVPPEGAAGLAPRIARGLAKLGIPPGAAAEAAGAPAPRTETPSIPVRGQGPLLFALVIGALGLLSGIAYFFRNLAPPLGSPEAFLAQSFPTVRWANVLANLAGGVLNAGLLAFAWQTRQGVAGARARLPRITAAMAAIPIVWVVVVWVAMHSTPAWRSMLPRGRSAMEGGTIAAFLVAFVPSAILFAMFRRKLPAGGR